MKYTQLKQDISKGAKNVYLLQGDDAYFLSRAEEMIKNAFLQLPELNFTSFDGDALRGSAIKNLADAVQACPFMAERRIVKVTDFYPSEGDYDKYIRPLIENFPPTSILIIVNKAAKKGAADLKRKGGVTYVDCNKAGDEEVARWIYLTLKRSGIYADVSVCMSIAQYCLCNMSRVAIETEKIIVYKGGGGTLSQEEADELVYKDADYRIYELTNAVAAGDYSKYIAIADELCGKGMDEVSILNSLFNYFRTLITVSSSRKSSDELAADLGMKEYGVKKSREQARKFGEERLSDLCTCVYGLLSDIKQGVYTPKNAFYIITSRIFFGERQ
ncbi:MAG: DNA polymerase III subunit delta [Clostridia bacterium]|nr:DNA polymerase III subunit delta [Clostridia bacterium]